MKKLFLPLLFCVVMYVEASAQQPNIEPYLSRIEKGDAVGVQAELPSLLNQYPNNPDVLYLQAVLTTDGAEAVRLYQNVVDNYPKSEWADDALFKVYKFYHAIGLYRTAEIKWNQLQANYPYSKHLSRSENGEQPKTQEQQGEQKSPPVETPVTPLPKTTEIVAPQPEKKEVPLPKFALQVGVYSTISNANKQKAFFEYQKFSAEIINKMIGSKELFVVLVGGYATADEAKAQGDELKRSFNIDYIVVTR